MSRKIGTPMLKGTLSGHFKTGDTHINISAAAREALPSKETNVRSCTDEDYIPELTQTNVVLYGPRYFEEVEEERQRRIDEFNQTASRKINKNSPVGCVGILKPDSELMRNLTYSEQVLFLRRSFDTLLELLDKTPENVVYAQVHLDEGNPHIHYELDGRTKDGRWSCTPMFQLKSFTALNESLPKLLKDRYGYDVEACTRHAPGTRKHQTKSAREFKLKQEEKKWKEFEYKIKQIRSEYREVSRDLSYAEAELKERAKQLEEQAKKLEEAPKDRDELVAEAVLRVLDSEHALTQPLAHFNTHSFFAKIKEKVSDMLLAMRQFRSNMPDRDDR